MVALPILAKYVHHILFVRSHLETKKILVATPKLVNYVHHIKFLNGHSEINKWLLHFYLSNMYTILSF